MELRATFDLMDKFGLRPHIHSVLPLERVHEAHAMLESQDVSGRIILQLREGWE